VSFVDSALGTIAFCWRVKRRDGVCLGFTTHDQDLMIDHLRYRAMPGMLPSAITLSDGFELDTLEVSGALTSEAINRIDLSAGRWDGAAVSIFAVDWENPGDDRILLARGEFGDVWSDGLDVPLAEEVERYRLIVSDGMSERIFILDEPRFTSTSSQQVADCIAVPFSVSVVQLGTWAESRPATAVIAD
jgi:hypothetical protein